MPLHNKLAFKSVFFYDKQLRASGRGWGGGGKGEKAWEIGGFCPNFVLITDFEESRCYGFADPTCLVD